MKLKISDIYTHPASLVRHGLHEETVQRYYDILEDLPPITVFDIKDRYRARIFILADGLHRLEAAKRRGWQEIEADVKQGSKTDAYEYALSANLKHGKPLTISEYKQAVRTLRYMHPAWGRDRLAKAVGRSPTFIEQCNKTDDVLAHCKSEGVAATPTDANLAEIYSAPREQWTPLVTAANKQDWTRDETRDKVRQIKTLRSKSVEDKSERIRKIISPSTGDASDRRASLNRNIISLSGRLEINQYDFNEARALMVLTYNALEVLCLRSRNMAKDLYAFRKTLNGKIPSAPELGSKERLEADELGRAIELIKVKT